jgi:hypothetical protein
MPNRPVDYEQEKGLNDTVLFSLQRGPENAIGGSRRNIRVTVGGFGLSPLPGCCGVVVCHGVWLSTDLRGTKVSEEFRKQKIATIKSFGYITVLATGVATRPESHRNLEKTGYKLVHHFYNPRTSNLVEIGVLDLGVPET